MRCLSFALVIAVLTGCASTHFTVRDSAGAPIPDVIAYHYTRSMFCMGGRTIVLLADDDGRFTMPGTQTYVAIGKEGYYPALAHTQDFPSNNICVTLFSTNESSRCVTEILWDASFYNQPFRVKPSDAAAYAQWQKYLEWLDNQPPFRSILPR